MHRIAVLLCVVVACKKSESPAPAPGSASSSVAGSGAAGSGSAAVVQSAIDRSKPPPRIECANVIPQTTADKWFKGLKAEHREPIVDAAAWFSSTTCRFLLDDKSTRKILLDYTCGPDFVNLDDYLKLLKGQIAAEVQRVPGVGRGGYRVGKSTIGAQHRTMPCIIHVDLSFLPDDDPERAKDWMALVGELEAALTDPPP